MRSSHAVVLAVLLASTAAAAQEDPPAGADVEKYPMPDFQVRTLDGREIDSQDWHGRVVLLDIWATWCTPCLAAAPHLDRMYEELKDDGLVMLGIAVQSGSEDTIRAAARKMGTTYPNAVWNEHLAEKIQGISSVPTYILIDREWNVEKLFVGATSPARIRQHVEALLSRDDASR